MDMPPNSASKNPCLFDIESSENPGESSVSTDLCLYDETWPCDPKVACGPKDKKLPEEERNLARKRFLSNEERREEEWYNVSTKLTLFTDPWTIKKELTMSNLGPLSRLLLNRSFVHNDILRYLPEDDQRMLHEGSGLTVNVYDHDTDSIHKLLLRKYWTKCRSYILLKGWRMDFVYRRALKKDDEIGFYWDRFDSKLHFRVLSRAPIEVTSSFPTMASTSYTLLSSSYRSTEPP